MTDDTKQMDVVGVMRRAARTLCNCGTCRKSVLRSDLVDAADGVQALLQVVRRIGMYPVTREDELSAESMRKLAREAADHFGSDA